MFGFQYYKADSATYVIKTSGGRVRKKGKGLSFFYMQATSSIAAIPVSVQEAPFIFNLQTADYQSVRIQGQISFRVIDPDKIADVLNFNLKADGQSYASEGPLKLTDRVVRAAQSIVQNKVQSVALRDSLALSQPLVELMKTELAVQPVLDELGMALVDASVAAITPSPETSKALEAEARESILKEADDAIYARRKSAVEQERTIKDAELQTELVIQQKEQEIAESRINNERAIMRGNAQSEQERIKAEIEAENQRKELVLLSVENSKQEADSEAYAIAARMKAFSELPVENLKAMALANMQPEQMMAMAMEAMAQNAGKIGELNIGPEVFTNMMKKAVRQ
ncbi:SPFH domain-containing protein [Gilvimarinus japonicus]|uniref:SPFH domain-containing protein n=1 Tax=Gilvimarinus japonicus TaxID=1796469 RepID=A0ABV7HV91_9GAMM